MNRRTFAIAVALLAIATTPWVAASAQGLKHSLLMRGQIVDITGDIATLCIGKADGAQPGQILDVYRAVPVSIPQKGNAPAFRRQEIGHVRIDSIVDDHFARASVIGGKVANHDIVELRPANPSH